MNELKTERTDMIAAMIMAITGIDDDEIKNLIKQTTVYQNIVEGDECTLYEDYSANLMDIIDEVKQNNTSSDVSNITPDEVSALNHWIFKNHIKNAKQLKDTTYSSQLAMRIIRKKYNLFNSDMQKKAAIWLKGTRNLFHGSLRQSAVWCTYDPILAGTRGNGKTMNRSKDIYTSLIRKGYYDFELSTRTTCRFVISKNTAYGEPICLIIVGCGNVNFSEVYTLHPFGSERLRTQEKIELSAGQYTLCIPTIFTET